MKLSMLAAGITVSLMSALIMSPGVNGAPTPTASAAPSAAPASQVPPSSVAGAGAMMETYTINAGQVEGYQPGDRVRIDRGGSPLGEASVFTVSPHSSVISAPGLKVRKGDQVVFLHRMVAIVSGPSNATCIVTKIEGHPPGTIVPVEDLAVRGRYNIFYYYARGHAKCKELQAEADKFFELIKSTPHTALFIVDVGFDQSPLALRYNAVSLPTLGVMNPQGQWRFVAHGHGCREIFTDQGKWSDH